MTLRRIWASGTCTQTSHYVIVNQNSQKQNNNNLICYHWLHGNSYIHTNKIMICFLISYSERQRKGVTYSDVDEDVFSFSLLDKDDSHTSLIVWLPCCKYSWNNTKSYNYCCDKIRKNSCMSHNKSDFIWHQSISRNAVCNAECSCGATIALHNTNKLKLAVSLHL